MSRKSYTYGQNGTKSAQKAEEYVDPKSLSIKLPAYKTKAFVTGGNTVTAAQVLERCLNAMADSGLIYDGKINVIPGEFILIFRSQKQ